MVTRNPAQPALLPPTDDQRRALLVVSAYLKRASTQLATGLLPAAPLGSYHVELLAQLRDDLGDSAALCETLIEVFDGWPDQQS